MGLLVLSSKTEAMFFHGKKVTVPPNITLRVDGTIVQIDAHIKYLGLTLDSGWTFSEYFAKLVSKMYANVVQSMVMYGSLIFAKDVIGRNKKSEKTIRQISRNLAIIQARCYRTVSHNAATLLAGSPPLNLVMEERAGRYQIIEEWKDRGIFPSATIRSRLRERSCKEIINQWKESLSTSPNTAGIRTIMALKKNLEQWTMHGSNYITF
ncbi:uncharacterized protein [Cardiocondyla obscurior]|uniref:uncharacterized protein n=1 Tax=Cardiocondyla obscurior TaxID=286306 RepID=UPI00396588A6